jgi:hypothetical protein
MHDNDIDQSCGSISQTNYLVNYRVLTDWLMVKVGNKCLIQPNVQREANTI